MEAVIGFSRRELIDLMLENGIHTSVDKFERLAVLLQQKVIEASGAAVKIEVIGETR